MTDFHTRLERLSPEQRQLLTLLLKREEEQLPEALPQVPAPVSFAQQRLWFLDQLEPGNPFYNMPLAVRLVGALDISALTRSLNEIISRHAVLRTTFASADGEPVQLVAPALMLPFSYHDLREAPAAERETLVRQLVDAEAQRPFDLRNGPLIRVNLFQLDSTQHVLLLNLHHIVCDGWSRGVLFRELAALYPAFAQGRPAPLPPLPIQYADFAIRQRQQLRGALLEQQLGYWRQQLAGAPRLQLPADYPRPARRSYRGGRLERRLPSALTAGLRELSQRAGATLFMVLLAAFQVLLARYSGQDDIVVGSGIANRTQADIEPLIGFFVNTLVLRTSLAGNPPFRALLERVREVCLGAYAHQDLPFERLVSELQPERELSASPLFQVAFLLQNVPLPRVRLPGLDLELVDFTRVTAKFDLTVAMQEMAGGLQVLAEYSSDLFREPTVARLLDHFEILLAGIVAQPDRPIRTIPLLSDAERHQVLVAWNDTRATLDEGTIPYLFEQQAARTPHAVALVFAGRHLTYQALNARANQLAHHLRAAGAGPDTCVCVCLERSLDLVIALLAILKAGGAYVPLDPSYPAERLAFMLNDAQPLVLLTTTTNHRRLTTDQAEDRGLRMEDSSLDASEQRSSIFHPPSSIPSVVALDRDWPTIAQAPDTNPEGDAELDNLAYVIYTSGSTGWPKGVPNTHAGLANLVGWHRRAFALTSADRASMVVSLSFDVSVWELWPYLVTGASLHLVTDELRVVPEALRDWLIAQAITISFLPTLLAERAITLEWPATTALRLLLTGGDTLQQAPPPALPFTLVNNYGPTENTVVTTSGPVAPRPTGSQPPPIGRPIANTQVYLLDQHMQPVPIGVVGELYIGGAQLARGYLNRPDLTAERFVPNPFADQRLEIRDWRLSESGSPISNLQSLISMGTRLYRTGDLARYRDDGQIEFLGRIDHQIKIRGVRIELGEIEATLLRHPAVRESAVLLRNDQPEGAQLVAYVTCQPTADADLAEHTTLETEQVELWQELYEATHQQPASDTDPLFDITGWNSSYTGQPIPADEMREWVEQTVSRIQALQPQRVLEIGFGTGLLLFRIAPACEEYYGVDVSAALLAQVRRQLDRSTPPLPQVHLAQRPAHDLGGLLPDAVDLVILNSVVQYFPSIAYLHGVLVQAVQAVQAGGWVLIGDVRSLPLLETFLAAVLLGQAPASQSCATLREQLAQRRVHEEELVIDPAYFTALPEALPAISQVHVLPRRGNVHNELTQFRYDVLLRVGPAVAEAPDCPWIDWRQQALNLPRLRAVLREQAPATLGVRGVPNARVSAAIRALEQLRTAAPATTVEALRTNLAESPEEEAVDPEALWALEAAGYHVSISWARHAADGRFDVLFQRAAGAAPAPLPAVFPHVPGPPRALATYANDPLWGKQARQLPAQLRQYLREQVPEPLVPARIVVLSELPQTPNGKLDRRALPMLAPGRVAEQPYAAPRTPTEAMLAEIWSTLLGQSPIGINDNFFALGGDSLLAARVVAAAGNAGLPLTLQQLLAHQTIAELAPLLAERSTLAPQEQALVVGPLPLTIDQGWYLAQETMDPRHRFNAALMFTVLPGLDARRLEEVVAHLLRHHDALRSRFVQEDGHWRARIAAPDDDPPFEYVHLAQVPGNELPEAIEQYADMFQGQFDLANGPLVRVVYFDCGRERPGRLLLLAHHLVADGYSLPILLEDIHTGYQQRMQGRAIQLPPKTSSIKAWAEQLNTYTQSPAMQAELAYWTGLPWEAVPHLPLDFPSGRAHMTNTSQRTVQAALGAAETQTLMRNLAAIDSAQMVDALVLALVKTISQWTHGDWVEITMVDSGRGVFPFSPNFDLSRTVGWLATSGILLLERPAGASPVAALRATLEQLRRIPTRGIGYHTLLFLSPDPEVVRRLAPLRKNEVLFNYLGQVQSQFPGDSIFIGPAAERVGRMREPDDPSFNVLTGTAMIIQNQLLMRWTYSESVYRRETIEHLMDAFLGVLRALVSDIETYMP